MNGQAILLNADYSFLNTVSVKKAICLITKGKAEIVKAYNNTIRNFESTIVFNAPKIIKLVKFVRLMFKKEVPLSKRNIFVRDGYQCQYCGKQFSNGSKTITIDHILPKSSGGKTTWDNCVTSCKQCNTYKGRNKLSETDLTLRNKPTKPTIGEFIQIKMKALGVDKTLENLFSEEEWK